MLIECLCVLLCVCVCVCVCVCAQGEETLKKVLRTFSAVGALMDRFTSTEQMKSALGVAAVSIA